MKATERLIAIDKMMESSGVRFGTSGARGLVVDMSDEVCYAYTVAFLKAIGTTSGVVALAMDLRPSSPAIAAACVSAIQNSGLSVDFCGAIPTPALAYYAQGKRMPAIMVTGSHIPFDRNGIKFYGVAGEITKDDELAIASSVVTVPTEVISGCLPEINYSAYQCFTERYLEFFQGNCLKGMRVGFYEHSSVARELLKGLLVLLGAEVISLGRTDAFVPIDTEAVSVEDIQQARRWAEQYGFDAIISTDGDGDRPLIGDERGDWLRGDISDILCAQYLGVESVVTTVSCNTVVELCGAFKNVTRTRIGSPYVIAGVNQLTESGARSVVGFEPNGGFLVGTTLQKNKRELSQLLTRDAVLPILCLLSMARERDCLVSELTQSLPARFTASDRIQPFPTENSQKILGLLAQSTSSIDKLLAGLCGRAIALDLTDGLRIHLENDEIVHFRPSGNAPELRCYAESDSKARADQLVKECLLRIQAGL